MGHMPTQEERRSVTERSIATLNAVISDITHNETMLLGMVIKQEENIREIKPGLVALNERLSTFEQSVNSRFDEHTALLTQILARLPEKP